MNNELISMLILSACSIVFALFVPRQLMALPKILEDAPPTQEDRTMALEKAVKRYCYIPLFCALLSFLTFVFLNRDNPFLIFGIIVILLVGSIIQLPVNLFYKKLFTKYKVRITLRSIPCWNYCKAEGFHATVIFGLTLYQIILLFI